MNECKIVQDLLPLYAEDLVSPETKAYVDTHCKACLECANQRQRMCADLNQEQTSVDYKKNMRWSIFGIVVKTLLVCFLRLADICTYYGNGVSLTSRSMRIPMEIIASR